LAPHPTHSTPPNTRPGTDLAAREAIERRRQARGLIVLALAVLVFSLLRFGLHRVFTPGWWRLW